MTPTQRILFGSFIRDAGIPSRFPLFSESHFNSFVQKAGGNYNLYCAISRYDYPDYYCDKILYDFDASWDGLFDIDAEPPEKFRLLRDDNDLAEKFLGEVVEEAKKLTRASIEEDIPVIGVFTGKGIHIYQLYQEEKNPRKQLQSTANRYKEELNLNHLDPKPIGDVMRISRIPGSQRMWERGSDRIPCPIYTIPLTVSDLLSMTPEWLLKNSYGPSTVSFDIPSEKPTMQIFDDYLRTGLSIPQQEFDPETATIDDEFLEWYIKRVVKMPCVSERALTNSPSHEIRLNFAIHLFNSGLTPNSVLGIISQLGWKDFDRKTTEKQLKQIYRRGYSEWSCQTMRGSEGETGLCVRSENPRECPVYGWNNTDGCRWRK